MPTVKKELTKAKNPPKTSDSDPLVSLWSKRLQASEKKLKDKGGDINDSAGWKAIIDFYEGKQWPAGAGGKRGTFDRITANLAKSNIDAIRPQLYFQNPRVTVKVENPAIAREPIPVMQPQMGPDGQVQMAPVMDPATGQPQIRIQAGTPVATVGGEIVPAQEQVDLLQAVDNHYLDTMRCKPIVKRIVNDALIVPYGVGKLEWVIEFETRDQVDKEGRPTGKTEDAVKKQYPKFTRIKPWCFLWDTELDEFDLHLAQWCAEIKFLSREDLEADKTLEVDFNEIEAEYYVDEQEQFRSQKEKDQEQARYKVYEIHDLRHGNFYVWVDGAQSMARSDEPSYYDFVEGSIYTLLGFDERIDDSFPIPYIDQIRSKAQAYNKLRSAQVNHAMRFNRKYRVLKGSFANPSEKDKWERGEDGVTVEVTDMMGGPEPISDAPITVDAYNVSDVLKREITEDLGVTSYNRSVREPGVDTAFEANLIQSGSDIKVQEKRDIVREFMRTLVRKLNQILKAYADTVQVVEIVGDKGKSWAQWSSKDIQGEFLEDVDIYTTLPFSEEVEKKQAMEMYSLAAADPHFNAIKLRQRIMRVMKWPEDLLYSEAEFAQIMQQQQQAAAEQAAAQEAQKQQSRTMRPTEGQVKRAPDMQAGITGPARRM